MAYIVIGGLGALALIILLACEIRENNKRIENGEPPIRHHDITDWPDPIEVIDRTPGKRK